VRELDRGDVRHGMILARVNPGLPIQTLRVSCLESSHPDPAPSREAPEYCSFRHLSPERQSAISWPPNRCVSNKSATSMRADT
jgi:hypothetical protein